MEQQFQRPIHEVAELLNISHLQQEQINQALAAEAAKFKTGAEMLAQQQLDHQQFISDIIPYTEHYAQVEKENEQMKSLLADPDGLKDYLNILVTEINKQNQQEQPRMTDNYTPNQSQYGQGQSLDTNPVSPNPNTQQSDPPSKLIPMGRDQFYSYVDPVELAKRQAEFQMNRISYPTQSTDGKTRIDDIHPSQRWQIMDRLEKEKVFGQNWK